MSKYKNPYFILYAYTFQNNIKLAHHEGYLDAKIGETNRVDNKLSLIENAQVRVNEQTKGTMYSHEPIIIECWLINKTEQFNSDRCLHRLLLKNNRRPKDFNGTGKEWFRIKFSDGQAKGIHIAIKDIEYFMSLIGHDPATAITSTTDKWERAERERAERERAERERAERERAERERAERERAERERAERERAERERAERERAERERAERERSAQKQAAAKSREKIFYVVISGLILIFFLAISSKTTSNQNINKVAANEPVQTITVKDGTKIGDMCYYEKLSNWRHCNGIDSWDNLVAKSYTSYSIIKPTTNASPKITPSPPTASNKKLSRDLNDKGIGYINENNYPDAIKSLRLALNASPDDAEILGNIGYAMYMNGDHLQAKEMLLKSLQIKPKRGSTWNNIGLVLAKLGHTEQATNCFINYYDYSSQKKTAELMLFAWRDRGDTRSLREAASAAIDKLALENP